MGLGSARFYCGLCGYDTLRGEALCPQCGAPLEVYARRVWSVDRRSPSMWRYRSMLPKVESIVSLNEGYTPLRAFGGVKVKDETRNPTGSYIDRGSSVLASAVKFTGATLRYIPDFTSSLTAYLRVAGSDVNVCLQGAYVELDELVVSAELGARILFGECSPTISYDNPFMVEGFKTIAYEIYEQAGHVGCISVPAEEGILAYSVARGFIELSELGVASEAPRIIVAVPASRVKAGIQDVLVKLNHVAIENVDDRDIVSEVVKLALKGLRVRPISATSYVAAKREKECIALLTGTGAKKARKLQLSLQGAGRLTRIQQSILEIVKNEGKATAYEIWKKLGGKVTLRGVYATIDSLSRRGLLTEELEVKGSRKVKVFSSKS
ncbi:MAG: pyridoxal-phosphate dependent enzyme [Acidilobaceae archaeon]